MIDELLQLHRGQGLDLFWRDSLQCPTEEEYVEMVLGSESALRIERYDLVLIGRNWRSLPYSRQTYDGPVG